jgi:hypothetical protein
MQYSHLYTITTTMTHSKQTIVYFLLVVLVSVLEMFLWYQKTQRLCSSPLSMVPVRVGDFVNGLFISNYYVIRNFIKHQTSPYNMHSPSRSPSLISSALSTFESNISKNKGNGSTSRSFLSNIASSRRPYQRRHSRLRTAKDIEEAYEQIIDDDIKTNPLISPTKLHIPS